MKPPVFVSENLIGSILSYADEGQCRSDKEVAVSMIKQAYSYYDALYARQTRREKCYEKDLEYHLSSEDNVRACRAIGALMEFWPL